jgi:hypothetical protein
VLIVTYTWRYHGFLNLTDIINLSAGVAADRL